MSGSQPACDQRCIATVLASYARAYRHYLVPRILDLAQGAVHRIVRAFACAKILACTPRTRYEHDLMWVTLRETSTHAGGSCFADRTPSLHSLRPLRVLRLCCTTAGSRRRRWRTAIDVCGQARSEVLACVADKSRNCLTFSSSCICAGLASPGHKPETDHGLTKWRNKRSS